MVNYPHQFKQWSSNLSSWKKRFLLMGLGLLCSLGLPPLFLFPLTIIGFSGFYLLLSTTEPGKTSFACGWWFGFGYYVSNLYWISFALLTDVAAFGWLIPFALFGIASIVAIYTAIIGLLTNRIRLHGLAHIVVFCVIWSLAEFARGFLFTGFPWNISAYFLLFSNALIQPAAYVGAYGLGLLCMLVATIPAAIGLSSNVSGQTKYFIALSPIMLVLMWSLGTLRLHQNPTAYHPDTMLRLVQPSIDQREKWSDAFEAKIYQRFAELATLPSNTNITHMIWPESALPSFIETNSNISNFIASLTPNGGLTLTGAIRAKRNQLNIAEEIYNSFMVINDRGEVIAHYDKHHLVPFGEYVPMRGLLPFPRIVNAMMDFTPGPGPQTLTLPNTPSLSPLICYEVIFPGNVIDTQNRPHWMVNVTNDGWYGNTSGPYQHFHTTRMRSVEEGLPLVRSANNGISAVIDPVGRIVAQTSLFDTTILDSKLPLRMDAPTPFSLHGNMLYILLVAFVTAFSVFIHKISKK